MIDPTVSVIVPHFDDNDRLALCLSAIECQDYEGGIEIIVVDNGSRVAPIMSGRARLCHEVRPGSYNARNVGIAESVGEILAFTDSDCRPRPGWLSAGVSSLAADNIGLVGGAIKIVPLSADRPTIPELFEVAVAFPQKMYLTRGRYAATANMLTTRAVINSVGPFDGHLQSGGDADWGQRVAKAGLRLVYDPDAVVEHPARVHHIQIIDKLRRTIGGERDRRPALHQALRDAIRHVVPPRKQIIASMRLRNVPVLKRLRVAAYCIYLSWVAASFRLWLQFSGRTSSRV